VSIVCGSQEEDDQDANGERTAVTSVSSKSLLLIYRYWSVKPVSLLRRKRTHMSTRSSAIADKPRDAVL